MRAASRVSQCQPLGPGQHLASLVAGQPFLIHVGCADGRQRSAKHVACVAAGGSLAPVPHLTDADTQVTDEVDSAVCFTKTRKVV